MHKNCRQCSAPFEVTDDDLGFFQRISPSFSQRTFLIPPPTFCPRCRLRRRYVWRNEYHYYARECDLCRDRIITVHSPDNPYPVYCNRCWWSDRWNPGDFGSDIESDAPFFPQFQALQARYPKPAMANDNHLASENIEYCQGLAYSKNCYLVTTGWRLEDCLYCTACGEARDLVDCRFVNIDSELLYECADSQRLYSCTFVNCSESCRNCHFGFDLRGCSDCFCCVGLRHKQFYIFNRPNSEDEYRAEVKSFNCGSYAAQERLREEFERFRLEQPHLAAHQVNCENSMGNNLFNCKNFVGFNVFGGEDCKYYFSGSRPQFCHDILVGGEHQWCYEGVNPDHSYMTAFTVWCWRCQNVYYSDNCHSCRNLFGCIGLRNASFCLLNKEYRPSDYQQLCSAVAHTMIKTGEWGEFFPVTSSPFAYNETIAQDNQPLTRDQAAMIGYSWKEASPKLSSGSAYEVPDHIDDVEDRITSCFLECAICEAPYKIMALELRFYRKMGIPIPRKCPSCRRKERFARTGSYDMWNRECARCGNEIMSKYSPERPEIVFCEDCYLERVYK